MAYTYSKLATYTVGSSSILSMAFLNIPQTYTDLVLKISKMMMTSPLMDIHPAAHHATP
jgi:hypothetical protein